MANRLLTGSETARVNARHGKGGYVRLTCDVPAAVKTRLVEQARREKTTLAEIVRARLC